MKTIFRKLALCALLGAPMSAHAAEALFTNGDFEIPAGASWAVDASTTAFTYPTSGGNPNGYGVMDANGGQWGIWINDNNSVAPLASLGLVAGETYVFKWDMKIEGDSLNSNPGGIKVESWNAGPIDNSGEFRPPTLIGSGATWETYQLEYTVNAAATGLKIVPLWGPNSKVGFDNFRVENTPVVPPPFVPAQIPNGDFEADPLGVDWATTETTPTYIATGGNPGKFVQLTDGVGAFPVLYAFNGAEKTFASLGLAPGDSYSIQMDMKLITPGTDPTSPIGGIRVVGPGFGDDFWAPALIGDGSTWETYTIDLTVPVGFAQAKFGLRPGKALSGASVAFDNVAIVLPAPPGPLQASIAQGTAVSWTAPSAINAYQAQESPDGTTWSNLGPKIVGNSITSVFDGSTSPFYQVLESVPGIQEAVYNAGFEEDDGFDAEFAEGWDQLGNTGAGDDPLQAPLRVHSVPNPGAHTGDAYMKIKVQNAAVGAQSGKSLIKQNTLNVFDPINGEIIPGNTYTFSFWAKQINVGVSYVQQYKVAILDSGSNILATTGDVNFSAGSEWTQVTHSTSLLAPEGAYFALIEIVGVTGAVDNGAGEVHIDDVSLVSDGFGAPNVPALVATTAPAVEISWPSATGQDYQVQSSTDLSGWSNFGGVISGDDTTKSLWEAISGPKKFYKVGELP